jgi:hypothetical protein
MLSELMIPFTSHAPKADLYDTSPAGQYVNTRHGAKVSWFLQQKTAGTNTGTATITVLAASDNAGTGAAAVPFKYRKKNAGVANSTHGNVIDATVAGFTTTANENTLYEIEIDASVLPDGKPFVALKLTETVNDPVDGAVLGLITVPYFVGTGLPEASA